MGDVLRSPRVAFLLFVFLTFQLSWAFAIRRLIHLAHLAVFVFPRHLSPKSSYIIPGLTTEFKWENDKVFQKRNFALVNDVECPKKPVGHGNAMSFTRGAVLFKSTVHGLNSETGPQICGSPDLPLHARRPSSC
ncbi:unnamed protein product [Prunus armeniaca]